MPPTPHDLLAPRITSGRPPHHISSSAPWMPRQYRLGFGAATGHLGSPPARCCASRPPSRLPRRNRPPPLRRSPVVLRSSVSKAVKPTSSSRSEEAAQGKEWHGSRYRIGWSNKVVKKVISASSRKTNGLLTTPNLSITDDLKPNQDGCMLKIKDDKKMKRRRDKKVVGLLDL